MSLSDDQLTTYSAATGLEKQQLKITTLFFPYASERQLRVWASNERFVHYTSVEGAIGILRNKEIWMRKASCMSDFSEVQHGLNCLYSAYRDENFGGRFKKTVEKIAPGLSGEIEKLFDGWTPHFFANTYLTCLSEHDASEDLIGRLSMWRAYGSNTGVALVIRTKAFHGGQGAFASTTSPVAYLRDEDFKQEFLKIVLNIEQNVDLIAALGREALKTIVFNVFRFAAVSTKHPGFKEEREWRIIHSPTILASKHLIREVRVIGGTPQPIYKIPLRDFPETGPVGVEIPSLLERIIVGPTQYPLAVAEAFVELLGAAGDKEAASKVFVSDIPIRR